MNIGNGGDIYSSGEIQVINFLSRQVTKNLIVFDVGANVGHYTNKLRQELDDSSNIFSFEPSAKTFQLLSQNVKFENVELNNFGFGNKTEEVALFSNYLDSGLSSLYNRRLNHFNIEMNDNEIISLRTLDHFVKEKNISHINLLKLDVEGNELNVLSGAKNLLDSQSIDIIQFEFGGCNIDSKTYFQDFFYLLTPNYDIFRILEVGFYPIKQYKEIYEQFITTNFLAVSKKFHAKHHWP